MASKKTSSNIERGKLPQPQQLPAHLEGAVIRGFGRGSKELGCPTANIPIEPYEELLKSLPLGVYYGWASVGRGPIYKAAISIGWNPYYKNDKKTIEVHIIHTFQRDFYGNLLRVSLQGYVRPEWDFTSLEELKKAIHDDIVYAEQRLDRLEPAVHAFFARDEHARM